MDENDIIELKKIITIMADKIVDLHLSLFSGESDLFTPQERKILEDFLS